MLQDQGNSLCLPESWFIIYKMRALDKNSTIPFSSGIHWLSNSRKGSCRLSSPFQDFQISSRAILKGGAVPWNLMCSKTSESHCLTTWCSHHCSLALLALQGYSWKGQQLKQYFWKSKGGEEGGVQLLLSGPTGRVQSVEGLKIIVLQVPSTFLW